ncbi:MAG: 50S ribosomal protein L15 [Candidatus Rhabdochlamydia sp.]
MGLDHLSPSPGSKKKPKRVGRGPGSGHGQTATRGMKGQKSRSGAHLRPGFEGGQMPLSRRLPKRGFRNPFRKKIITVNLEQLKNFPQGSVIDKDVLVGAGLVKRKGDSIKILGKGNIEYPVSLKVDMVSQGAREKIEAAGGSIIIEGI